MDAKLIIKEIQAGKLEKIYFLHGEEPYFIDEITHVIEATALEPHEKDFNQMVIYGKDAEALSLLSELKNYPMMGNRKLVILKEAQEFKGIDLIESYFENPADTTIFVINYKYKTFDARKKSLKSAAQNGLVFKSEKVKDYKLNEWIEGYVKSQGFGVTSKACMLLAEFLGNDLGRIVNEIDKLAILLEKGTTINDIHIEENIGISKDYNIFELVKAIGVRDVPKAFNIVQYFNYNPKAGEIIAIIPTLFNFFSQLMRIHFLPNKSKEAVAAALRVHPFIAGELMNSAKVYNPKKAAANIAILHEFDLKAKGVGNTGAFTQGDLLKEMIYRLLH
jgi:DNA polymerase-3 subunit delta